MIESKDLVPAARSVERVGDGASMSDWAAELVDRARREGVELTGQDGLLTALVGQVLQRGLEVEMTDHLGYERPRPRRPRLWQQPERPLPQDRRDRGR